MFQASATLAISMAHGPGGRVDDPYAMVTPEIRLCVLVDEPKIQPEEISGLAALLVELDLATTSAASAFVAPIPVGARVRCAASLTLPPPSTEALLGPLPAAAEWFPDVHQAAYIPD